MAKASVPAAPAPAPDGYWTIQVILQDRNQIGRRFVCRASGDVQARSMATNLTGSTRATVGYDYHRIDNPHGKYALDLTIGQSQAVEDPDRWAVLGAARRSA